MLEIRRLVIVWSGYVFSHLSSIRAVAFEKSATGIEDQSCAFNIFSCSFCRDGKDRGAVSILAMLVKAMETGRKISGEQAGLDKLTVECPKRLKMRGKDQRTSEKNRLHRMKGGVISASGVIST